MADEGFQLEICYPTAFPMLIESTNNRLSGIFSSYAVSYLEFSRHIFNSSIVVQDENPGVGHQVSEDGKYDGCLGKLQRGEADFMANAIDYPLDIVNVSQGHTAFDEQIAFTGAFARPESVKKADFMRSIYAFHWSVYFLILIYLLVFSAILKVRSRLKRNLIIAKARYKRKYRSKEVMREKLKRKLDGESGFVDVVRAFAWSNFLEPDSPSFSVLVLFLNLFSFLILTYFNSLLNTDLVIPGEAKMFENYEQIMQNGVKPIFFDGMSYYGDLKNAKKGSKERDFWNWAVNKFGEKELFVTAKFESVGPILPDLLAGNVLLFTGDTIALTIRSTLCETFDRDFARMKLLLQTLSPKRFDWDKFGDMQLYTRKEPSSPNKIKSIIFGKRIIENAELLALISKVFLWSFEHGHLQACINILARAKISLELPGFMSILGPVLPERSHFKQRCKECNVPTPKIPDIDYLTLENFSISFSICAGLIVCSCVVFYVERLVGRAMKARTKFITEYGGQIVFLTK